VSFDRRPFYQSEAVRRVVREGVLRLEPSDLERKVPDLSAWNVRRVKRDHIHQASKATWKGREEITAVKGRISQAQGLRVGPGLPNGLGG
jgi:hypothetical protein